MVKHVKIKHLKEKNSKCDVCGQSFSCLSAVNHHKKRVHFGYDYRCQICEQENPGERKNSFLNEGFLQKHYLEAHQMVYTINDSKAKT